MRFTLLFLIALFSIQAEAQQIKFEQKISWKGNSISVKSFSNKDKNLSCIVLLKSDSLRAYLFDSQIKLIKDFKVVHGLDEEMLGGFTNDDKITVVLKNKYSDQFHNYVFNLKNNSTNDYLLNYDLKGKKLIGTISSGNNFYYITAEKKEPQIHIANFKTEGEITDLKFDLSTIADTKLTKKDLWEALSISEGFSRTVDAATIDESLACDPEKAKSKNKLYLRDDNLLLLMDDDANMTKVFMLNVSNSTATYRQIIRAIPKPVQYNGITETASYNSYLIDNTLYHIYASSKQLILNTASFDSGKPQTCFNILAQEEITFRNTPILQEGTVTSSDEKRELVKTKQFIRKMLAGEALITGYNNAEKQHELTIGAFKEMKMGGGPPMMGGYGGGASLILSVGLSASWGRTTRFKTLINAENGEHIPGELKADYGEIVEQMSIGLNTTPSGTDVFKTRTGIYFTFYNKDDKTINILKVSN